MRLKNVHICIEISTGRNNIEPKLILWGYERSTGVDICDQTWVKGSVTSHQEWITRVGGTCVRALQMCSFERNMSKGSYLEIWWKSYQELRLSSSQMISKNWNAIFFGAKASPISWISFIAPQQRSHFVDNPDSRSTVSHSACRATLDFQSLATILRGKPRLGSPFDYSYNPSSGAQPAPLGVFEQATDDTKHVDKQHTHDTVVSQDTWYSCFATSRGTHINDVKPGV